MRKVTIFALALLLMVPLFAAESDNPQTYTVRTGWTVEKAAYEAEWKAYAVSERQTALQDLEARMSDVLPQLPENQYCHEEQQWVGYRIKIEQAHTAYVNEPTGWHYAELANALDQAEALLAYIERQNNIEKNEPDPGQSSFIDHNGPTKPEDILVAEGWDLGYPNMAMTDDYLPSVATAGNHVFISIQAGTPDTLWVYHSDDYGNTWEVWHTGASGSVPRVAFDVVVEPNNPYLYCSYQFQSNDIWIRRWGDFADSSAWDLYEIEGGSDVCGQPHLSVEHQYADHRVCCMYYNTATDELIIAQSTDQGATWATVHTTSWTTAAWPRIKGCQGASGATTDRYYFVARKAANTLTVFESTGGFAGSWTETDYVHSYNIDGIDISASHNHNEAGVVVAFGYEWTATDYNVRIYFRMEGGTDWVSSLVDGDGLMTKTPVVTCDGEYQLNTAGPDWYHLSYYKDHDGDDLYTPVGLKCPNDSVALDGMYKDDPTYFEDVNGTLCDTVATIYDNGRPASYYQIDMTTVWNPMWSQWFPAIAWIREYTTEADVRLSFLDENWPGVEEMPGQDIAPVFASVNPNPSLGSAQLSYTVGKHGNVDVSLFDASGRLVNNLVHEVQTAGNYTLTLDNQNLAAGIYFIKVVTDEGANTTTMTVIR
jgi:hypothetical protein